MFTENPWYSKEMFRNQQKYMKTLDHVVQLEWDRIWEGTPNANTIFIQRFYLMKYCLSAYLFQTMF